MGKTHKAPKVVTARLGQDTFRKLVAHAYRKAATGTYRKTSVSLPLELWRAAKIEAMDEGIDMADVIVRALQAYLSAKKGGA